MKYGKLAILGGDKICKTDGKFINPKITKEIENAVIEQLHTSISIYDCSGIFKLFEDAFAGYHNQRFGVVTSSGTSALWSMYEGIGLKKGDEIICPVYTFFATNSPVFFTGATPIYVDCDKFGNLNPNNLRQYITDKTKAIVVTHMWGYPCEMDKLRALADEFNLFLLEDCSHAHGASYGEKKCGEWGDAAIFSLQGNKIMTGGEGGILITSNEEIFERAVFLGHYNKRCKQQIREESPFHRFSVTGKGMKLRAHPLAIRISYTQFLKLDSFTKQKQNFAEHLIRELDGLQCIEILKPHELAQNSWYAMIMRYTGNCYGVTRKDFVDALIAEGAVEVDIPNSTCPVNILDLFVSPEELFPDYEPTKNIGDFPNAKDFYDSIIKIPIWFDKCDIDIVNDYVNAFKKVCIQIEELKSFRK